MFAGHNKLGNLVVYLDNNKKQSSGKVSSIMNIDPIKDKWKSFGWNVIRINGHSHKQILSAYLKVKKNKPNIIIADTVKGNGIKFFEKKNNCHYDRLDKDKIKQAYKELLS